MEEVLEREERYKVMEECLKRAMTELRLYQVKFGEDMGIKCETDCLMSSPQVPDWMVSLVLSTHLCFKV